MTRARFLFNDLFHEDSGAGNWTINQKDNNPKSDDEIKATLRDGRLETSELFFAEPVGNNQWIFGMTDDAPNEICNAFGLVNTTMAGCTIQGASGSKHKIIGNNFIFHNPGTEVGASATFFIDTNTNNPNAISNGYGGKIGLLFAGCVEEFDLLYPVGWKPPFVADYDDRIIISDMGYPIARHRKRKPFRCTIPFRFLIGETERDRVVALIQKMQREPFLWQWNVNDFDHTMYAWLVSQPNLTFTSPNIMQADIEIAGYWNYDN